MTKQDFAEFNTAMNKAALALDVTLTQEKIAVYFEDLADFPIDAVRDALTKARREHVYAGFPKVGDIRKHIEGTTQDRAELAWRTTTQLCTEQGAYPSLQVTDGALAFALDHLGGWCAFCAKVSDSSPEMLRAYENQFKASYRLGEARKAEARYFLGAFESHNRTVSYRPGRDEIRQPVAMLRADRFLVLSMPFDLRTGQLCENARESLRLGGESLRRYLPAPAPQKRSLPPATPQEMASPEDVAALKREIAALSGRQRLNPPADAPENSGSKWTQEVRELLANENLPF